MFGRKKDAAKISDKVPVFHVRLIGVTETFIANGKGCSYAPVQRLWDNAPDEKYLRKVAIYISTMGIVMRDADKKDQIIGNYPIENISFCNVDRAVNERIFSWICRHPDKPRLDCQAVLCSTRSKAQTMAVVLSRAFQIAYRDWKSHTRNREVTRRAAELSGNQTGSGAGGGGGGGGRRGGGSGMSSPSSSSSSLNSQANSYGTINRNREVTRTAAELSGNQTGSGAGGGGGGGGRRGGGGGSGMSSPSSSSLNSQANSYGTINRSGSMNSTGSVHTAETGNVSGTTDVIKVPDSGITASDKRVNAASSGANSAGSCGNSSSRGVNGHSGVYATVDSYTPTDEEGVTAFSSTSGTTCTGMPSPVPMPRSKKAASRSVSPTTRTPLPASSTAPPSAADDATPSTVMTSSASNSTTSSPHSSYASDAASSESPSSSSSSPRSSSEPPQAATHFASTCYVPAPTSSDDVSSETSVELRRPPTSAKREYPTARKRFTCKSILDPDLEMEIQGVENLQADYDMDSD